MKKIMAVLLSIAVVFAFAACDNSTTANPYFGQQVQRVVLESAPDYLVGETIDPADVKILVEYDNGSVVLTGEDVGMYREDGGFTVSQADGTAKSITFKVNYGSDNPFFTETPAVKDWTIIVPVYAFNEIKVDATNGAKTVEKVAINPSVAPVDTEGLTFALVYNKGTEKVERTVTTNDFIKLGIGVSATANVSTAEVNDEVKVNVSAIQVFPGDSVPTTNNLTVTLNPKDWKVSVVADQSTVIKDVALTQDTTVDVFNLKTPASAPADETYTNLDKNTIGDLPWVLTITLGNEKTIKLKGVGEIADSDIYTEDGVASVSVDFVDFTKDTTLLADVEGKEFNAKVSVTLSGSGMKAFTKLDTLDIEYTKDYPVEIEAVVSDPSKTFTEGMTFTRNIFDFYNTKMASGITYSSKYKKTDSSVVNNIELVTTSVEWGATVDDETPVTFKWNGEDRFEPEITGTINVVEAKTEDAN